MKLIVILAFISFASTHPVNRTGLAGSHYHFTEDEHILFHLSKMVLDLKNSGIPESITKIPIPQLTNCITADQRKLVKDCAIRAKHSLKTGTPMKVDGNESMQNKSSEELMHENSHSAFPMTIGCIIESFIPTGIAGEVDLTHLKMGIINTTSLSMSQKNSAGIDFESCMSSNMTIIPHPHRKEKNSSSTDQLGGANKKNFKEIKTILCISKAIILNGCADVPRTATKLEMAPQLLQSSENLTEAKTHDKAEMLAHPHPHLSSVPHDHDFLDLVTEIVMKIKFKGDTDKINSFEPSKLLSCVPQEQREAIHKRCEENAIGDHHHMIMADVAECILVDLVKALNNETGIVDVKVIQTGIINNVNSLSADQKQLATASVESCIESNFTLTHSSHSQEMAVEDEMSNLLGKYGKRNDPMRTMICVVKALIENGCSSTRIEKRAVKLTASYYNTDSSSGENSNDDTSDEF